ncbi:hypothetical protein ACR2VR_26815, partial [Klebsiella pneumoniae]
MESIVKQPLSRNLWAIMKEFNVLPTEQRFKDLDDYQIEFIIGNMNRDVYEHNKQLKHQPSACWRIRFVLPYHPP